MSCKLRSFIMLIGLTQLSLSPALAKSDKELASSKLPAILKADIVDGDQNNQTITATGNVELSKGLNKIYADKVIYQKKDATIDAAGNVRIKNNDVGKLFAKKAKVKDDFSKGDFEDGVLIFNDGTYIESKKVSRELGTITTLKSPIYSICPNDKIVDNSNIDGQKNFAAIRSYETIIDQKDRTIKTKHGFLEIYGVPVFYTPYLRNSLNQKERKTGFLRPEYTNSNKFGLGFLLPYYFNLAPNKDLTLTPDFNARGTKIMLSSKYNHFTKYGKYNLGLSAANNDIDDNNDRNIVNRTNKKIRWEINGRGNFDFTPNSGFQFDIQNVSDKDYLRDYKNNYLSHTSSKAKLDYINNRTYLSTSLLRFQELEDQSIKENSPFIIPQIDFETRFKPIFYKEQYQIGSNFTSVNRNDGLQYSRFSITPEIIIPFNLKGNLFRVSSKIQGDLYNFNENYSDSSKQKHLDSNQSNYRPEISLEWKLPLIKKDQNKTIIIEPMANFIASSYYREITKLANEDSNNSQLSFSNLFTNDHIAGFDRNEAGERVIYGFRSSLFNKLGKFGLTLGQSYHKSYEQQDIIINGIGKNKSSNIVGLVNYKTHENFSIDYIFQLNNHNYNNELNEIITRLNFDNFQLSSNYLLIKESSSNSIRREQMGISSKFKIADKWWVQASAIQDLESSQTISKSLILRRNGCCTDFSLAINEQNPENLNRPERSVSINFLFKSF